MKLFLNFFFSVLPLIVVVSAVPRQAYARNLFVSTLGSDSTTCTEQKPCREIRRALALVQAGDTVLVADGSYLGFTAENINGTAQNPITIKAQGKSAEVTPTSDRGTYGDRDNIYISFCQYLVIDGLRSSNAPRAAVRLDASHFTKVKNGVFGNNGTWGIFTNHSNDILLENNETFASGKEHGIYISNSGDNPTIRGNRIHDNNANGLHMNGDLSAGGHGGVVGDGIISGALIENNIIYNNGRSGGGGINMDGVQDSVIRNNVLFNNHASGIVAYRIDGAQGPKNLQIYHNTVDMADDARYALQLQHTSAPIIVRNNILYNRNPRRGGLAYGEESDVPNVDSAYNVFGGTPIIAFDDWSLRITLTQWQAQGKELSSFVSTVGELFVDSEQGDYSLRSNSPAINRGETLSSVGFDREGTSRPQGTASDIGAYEYLPGDGTKPTAPTNLRQSLL